MRALDGEDPLEARAGVLLQRRLGLSLAMGSRILLLLSLAWIMRLTEPLFSTFGHAWSGRDMILIGGGLFLLFKSTKEVHASLEGDEHGVDAKVADTLLSTIVQIAILDIVFSIDSIGRRCSTRGTAPRRNWPGSRPVWSRRENAARRCWANWPGWISRAISGAHRWPISRKQSA